jgi:hypothetical protein
MAIIHHADAEPYFMILTAIVAYGHLQEQGRPVSGHMQYAHCRPYNMQMGRYIQAPSPYFAFFIIKIPKGAKKKAK